MSSELYMAYSSEDAIFRAATGQSLELAALPPRGRPWPDVRSSASAEMHINNHLPPTILTSLDTAIASTPAPAPTSAESDPPIVPTWPALPSRAAGVSRTMSDHSYARSVDFIREAMQSREAQLASAQGDVGRLILQVEQMLFTFTAGSHKKYAQYFLEVFIDLELESSPELRATLLEVSLSNITGLPGKHKPCDLLQEYFNRILSAIVQHKGKDYGERFIRGAIARNLHHFQRIKTEILDGVDLSRRSAAHAKPSSMVEMRILLNIYQREELHCYRPSRTCDKEMTLHESDFKIGCAALRNGQLKKWLARMTGMWDKSVPNDDTTETNASSTPMGPSPMLACDMVDGRLVMSRLDPEDDAALIMRALDEDGDDDEGFEEDSRPVLDEALPVSGTPAALYESDSDEEFPDMP